MHKKCDWAKYSGKTDILLGFLGRYGLQINISLVYHRIRATNAFLEAKNVLVFSNHQTLWQQAFDLKSPKKVYQ